MVQRSMRPMYSTLKQLGVAAEVMEWRRYVVVDQEPGGTTAPAILLQRGLSKRLRQPESRRCCL